MAVTIKKINEVMAEVKRFTKAAKAAKAAILADSDSKYGCKETGAVKMASMDLSRELTILRNSDY
jgi:hypothetical protein